MLLLRQSWYRLTWYKTEALIHRHAVLHSIRQNTVLLYSIGRESWYSCYVGLIGSPFRSS